MKKIGIFYGSSTGTTESIAHTIAQKLGVASNDVHDASKLTGEMVKEYDVLVLGTSTWGCGELHDGLSSNEVALFGCGDSESYCDTFCDGIGVLYEELKGTGCKFIGNHVPTGDYNFSSSTAVVDGEFAGLPLDEMNESDKTEGRIDNWVKSLKD